MILGVAPLFDLPTSYSIRWHERLYGAIEGDKAELKDADAVRARYNRAVTELNPSLITFYGHGSEDALIDDDESNLLDRGNMDTTRGREVYTMCCLAASSLGADAYRKGCKAWWGYTRPFSFTTDDAEVFGRLANMGLLLRLKRSASWPTAVEAVKDAYDDEIDKGGNPFTIMALVNNRNCLVCWCEHTPPPTDCVFRMLGVRLLGEAGQRVSRLSAASALLFLISYGTVLQSQCKLIHEGGCLGLVGLMLSFLICFREYLNSLKR